jgi:large subunit ribosomal protein L22
VAVGTRRRASTAPAEEQAATEVRATARFVRTAPRKAQLVVGEIRGRGVAEARTMLAFMTRAAARDVEKVLQSAVANAEANHGLSANELYVSGAYVGAGPTLKRWRARARGRVGRIRKRSCHITVLVAPVSPGEVAAAVQEATQRGRKAQAAAAPPVAAAEAVTAAAEEQPKRTRARKPAAEAAGEVPSVEAAHDAAEEPAAAAAPDAEQEQAAEAPEATAEPAPKPRRTRARKTQEEAGGEAAGETKPKPARRRKKADADSEKES